MDKAYNSMVTGNRRIMSFIEPLLLEKEERKKEKKSIEYLKKSER